MAPIKNFFSINSTNVKLVLYILTASLAALLADLQRLNTHTVVDPDHLSLVQIVTIVINFVLQGLIAWRAFIDNACGEMENKLEKEADKIESLLENQTKNHSH